MADYYTVKIDAVTVKVQKGSTNVEKRIEERSTASFIVVDELGNAEYLRGEPVEIYDGATLIFSGFVSTPTVGAMSPTGGLLHRIQCMDNHYLADKRLAVKSYSDKTAGFIVADLITDYLTAEGIGTGAVQAGATLSEAIFNYVKVSDCLDALAEASGFTWFIDEALDLYFIDRTTYSAPWNLDGSTHRAIQGTMRLASGNSKYRNTQYVRGGKGLTALQTENFTGDGDTKSFALGYPLAQEPTITEDAAPMTVGIKGIETGKDYYWNKGDAIVYAEVAPAGAVAVEVQYYGQYPLIGKATNYAGIADRAAVEGVGSGQVEDMATETQHETSDGVSESAKAKLANYCREAEKLTFQTYEAGLEPGQMIAVTYSPFGYTAHDMLISAVTVATEAGYLLYSVEAVTGPLMGSWTRFFSDIVKRMDNTIKLGDALLLVLFVQEEELDLSEATDINSDDFSGGIVNRWIQEPPTTSEGTNVEHEVMALAEAPAIDSHATEDYTWEPDTGDTRWNFFTWG